MIPAETIRCPETIDPLVSIPRAGGVNYRQDVEGAQAVFGEIAASGGQALEVQADLADERSVKGSSSAETKRRVEGLKVGIEKSSQPSPDQVGSRIYDALVEFGTDRELLQPDATLEELDIDSLDLFELGQILNHEFGIEVDPQDFDDVTTVGQAQDAMLAYLK